MLEYPDTGMRAKGPKPYQPVAVRLKLIFGNFLANSI